MRIEKGIVLDMLYYRSVGFLFTLRDAEMTKVNLELLLESFCPFPKLMWVVGAQVSTYVSDSSAGSPGRPEGLGGTADLLMCLCLLGGSH